MQRISILGSGWLGLPLAVALKQLGHPIKASSRSGARLDQIKQANISAHFYDIEADLHETDFLQSDVLIINITSKNLAAFKNLAIQIENSPIQKVLFISSTSVYQESLDPNAVPITESNIDALRSCPLLDIENLLMNNRNFETSIIRMAGLMGYQRHPGKFFIQTKEDGSFSCKAIKNPDAAVNMIHRDDCIAIIKAVLAKQTWGEVFNACSTSHPTRREFYSHAINDFIKGESIVMNFIASDIQHHKIISNEKVKQRLGHNFIYDDLLSSVVHSGYQSI